MNKSDSVSKANGNTSSLIQIFSFVFLAYLISWGAWFIGFSNISGLNNLSDERFTTYLLIGSFGPSMAALIVTTVTGGKTALLNILKGLIKVKINWRIYLFAFFTIPVIGLLIYLILGVPTKIPFWQIAVTMLPLAPLNALIAGIIFGYGPLGEETGWRGFLQDKLQEKYHHYINAIFIGVIWIFWHLPLFRFVEFREGLELPIFIPLYTLSGIVISLAMGHLWRWSKGSIFLAIFFHAVVNTATSQLFNTDLWDLGKYSSLQVYLMMLSVLVLTGLVAEILSKTTFKRFD